jgi:hypothetical protein
MIVEASFAHREWRHEQARPCRTQVIAVAAFCLSIVACNAILDIRTFPPGADGDAGFDATIDSGESDVTTAADTLAIDAEAGTDGAGPISGDAVSEAEAAVEPSSSDAPDDAATDGFGEATINDSTVDAAETSSEASSDLCGNGHVDPGEQCDLGSANSATAYDPRQVLHAQMLKRT